MFCSLISEASTISALHNMPKWHRLESKLITYFYSTFEGLLRMRKCLKSALSFYLLNKEQRHFFPRRFLHGLCHVSSEK